MKKLTAIIITMVLMLAAKAYCQVIPQSIYAVSDTNVKSDELKAGKILTFNTLEEYSLKNDITLLKNTELHIKITKYIPPKRGKRDGYLKIQLVSYTAPDEKTEKEVNDITGTLRLSTPRDLKETAKHAGVTAAGHILKIPGFSQAVAVSKGLIKPNPEQSRLKSAGENLYESTPLTYTEKGEELNIETDSIVVLRLKSNGEDD